MDLSVGTEYTFKAINQVVVIVHENVEPGGVNFATAHITFETAKGVPYTIPASLAERYLTDEPPVKPGKYTAKS